MDDNLTAWERRVAITMAQGYTRPQAAEKLHTTVASIHSATVNIRTKTGARNLVNALLLLSERGLIGTVDTAREVPPLPSTAGRVAQALHVKLVTELDWRSFCELRSMYDTAVEKGW